VLKIGTSHNHHNQNLQGLIHHKINNLDKYKWIKRANRIHLSHLPSQTHHPKKNSKKKKKTINNRKRTEFNHLIHLKDQNKTLRSSPIHLSRSQISKNQTLPYQAAVPRPQIAAEI
jgi:hypothetical protein